MFSTYGASPDNQGIKTYMQTVYRTVFFGLLMSTAVAYLCSNGGYLHNVFFHRGAHGLALTGMGWIGLLAPLGMVFAAGFLNVMNWSYQATNVFYYIFCAIMGVGLYAGIYPYSPGSVVFATLATAGAFGFLSLFGYMTNKDLSGIASFCIMALWGLIIYPIIAMLFHLPSGNMVTGIIGIMVFAVLTAFDTQRIKQMYNGDMRIAVWGALNLYLDFINLLMDILRTTGSQNNDD